MNDKELLKLLGINNTTITLTADDEYLQLMLEKKIDNYLKKLDEEKKKEEQINFYKKEYENFKEKKKFINTFNDSYVYGKIKNTLIRDGFIYRCPFCLDVSHEYMKPIKKKEN